MNYIILSFCSICLVLSTGCKSSNQTVEDSSGNRLYVPKWTFLAKASAVYNKKHPEIPKRTYVFPALRLNAQMQAIDQLAYRTLDDGSLSWYSPAPLGSELKAIIEQKLSERGFYPITFGELTAMEDDHSVVVINPYYTEARASEDNPAADVEQSWTTFNRITATTFPKDLNPNAKRELMNLELVSLFNGKNKGNDVVKRSGKYLLDYIGITREWSESINLLN